MDKSISTDEKTLDVKEEPTITDLVVETPVTTSHDGAGLLRHKKRTLRMKTRLKLSYQHRHRAPVTSLAL